MELVAARIGVPEEALVISKFDRTRPLRIKTNPYESC